jgi:hypothetical protein
MPSLIENALNIAREEIAARNNEGQGRLVQINNRIRNLKNVHGNANVNNALARARSVIRKTHARRQARATGNRRSAQRAAMARMSNKFAAARARTGQAVMAGVLRELNNLRWVPIHSFQAPKRGRSPSVPETPLDILEAIYYSPQRKRR